MSVTRSDIQNNFDLNEDQENSREGPNKRKFTWFLHEWAGDQDPLNAREPDGSLKKLKQFTGQVPEDLANDDLIELFNLMHEVHYDSENPFALGGIGRSEYFLVPTDMAFEVCPVDMIGAAGPEEYEDPSPTMAAVYALAKDQAKRLKLFDEDQIKWALLRLEAFRFGWFANQTYTLYKPAPNDSMKTMLEDIQKIRGLIKHANALCCFLPFMTEYHVRSFGSAYLKSPNPSEYLSRAQKLAASASLSDCLTYMDQESVHGRVLAWIGVKRPMQVLRNANALARVPVPFQLRAYWAPAGQALISSSIAVIDSLKDAGMWEEFKSEGGYDDTTLFRVGANIAKNPWKYHMMHQVFGETAPDGDEAKDVAEATKVAIKCAPVLQAYASIMLKNTRLGGIKVLKRHADANPVLFLNAQSYFRTVLKKRSKYKSQVFSSDALRRK